MNTQIVVDYLDKPLKKLGWKEVRRADSLEPDTEITDVPVAWVFRGPSRPRGESRLDNFTAQITQELFGIHVAAARDELDARLLELETLLLGKVLPGFDFECQYAEGKPTVQGTDIEWWADMYFTERDRRQQL